MLHKHSHRFLRVGAECLFGGFAVALISLVCFRCQLHLPAPTCLYLLVIVLLSLRGSFASSVVVSFIAVGCLDYFFVPPILSLDVNGPSDILALITFLTVSATITRLVSRLRKLMQERLRQSERQYAVTLSSIGDAVIATDDRGRVTFMNRVAETLTGWPLADASGRAITEVFRIVNEETRQTVEDPAAKVLRLGTIVGLANHTALLARDGRELPIDDSGSPIIDDNGHITGVVLVFRDMTQRRKAEEAELLRRSKERLELAVHGSNLSIWEFDMSDGRIENSRSNLINVWELLGYDPRTAPTDFANIVALEVHPEDLGRLSGAVQAFLAGKDREFEAEYRVRHKDGSDRWRLTRGVAVRDPEGKAVQFIGSCVDITNLKRAEEALRESEQRFRTFVNHATDGFFLHGDGFVVLDVNRQACESLGYTRDELLGMNPLDFDPAVTPAFLEEIDRRLMAGEVMAFESRHRRKDGTVFPVEIRGQAFWEGGRRFTVALARDITERKRAEEALGQSENRWRSLTEALPQLVWTATPDGACDYFSTQWTEYTGVPASELLGWQWLETLHPDDREPTRQFWTDSVAGRHDYDVEYRVRRSDGVYRWFKTRGVPIRDSEGGIFKWFGTCTDITDGKKAEEDLRLAKEAAESANRAKDEFLANVSHEIRTPMNAILGLTSLVLGTRLNDGQRQSLATVKSAANSLLGIINDLLDFSKIEAGKLELDLGEFSLRAALGDTLRALAIRAHQKGLELASNVQSDVPDGLIGDAGRLRQVLLNIIGNAIKFTEKGEVVVQVSAVADAASTKDEVELLFTVRDTGIGITREKHAAIFRAFEQEDSSTTRKYGGSGLGLTIAAQLAALMGGRITVESEPGQGSTFRISTRFRRSAKPAALLPGNGSADLLEDLRVLIVDDNLTNRQILEEWLQDWRMRPLAVGDGAAAVDALRRAGEMGTPYSLVLLDGRMPDTDGLTLAAHVRQCADISSTRIILLTSDDTMITTARSREMGISAHLVKPVQQSELLETIRHVITHMAADACPELSRGATAPPAGSTAACEPALPTPAAPLHILVAEDNEFNVTLLKQLFDRKGHRAFIAGDGREALALATGDSFDVLLLDIHLPEMDGFAVARAIREQERGSGKHLPIIAFTARSGKQDRERCLAAGMDDFLSKPVQAEALWAVIDRVVAARTPQNNPESDLLDPEAVLRACGDDPVILEKICQAFQRSAPNQMAQVRSALRNKDAPGVREAAHTLSSTLAAFSTIAGMTASNLEDEAACGNIQECVPLVERLESICSKLVKQTHNLSIEELGLCPSPLRDDGP